MGRTATQRQRSSLPTTQNAEQMKPTITEDNRTATSQQGTPLPASQKAVPEQPTITENAVRLRAYELYLKRGAIPGDEVSDWLQAEQEFLGACRK